MWRSPNERGPASGRHPNRDACGFDENTVPEFTTICRHFNALDYDLVKKLFMDLVRVEYPDMDVHAMLGDGLYDSPSQRKHVEEVLEAEYLTPVNTRRGGGGQ